VGEAIGQFALKNSKFYKQGDFTGLDSARKLARKLFGVLSDVKPAKSHLVVDGKFCDLSHCRVFLVLVLKETSDFYPYFRSTSEAVSIMTNQLTSVIDYQYSMTPLPCLTRTVMATYRNVKCGKPFNVFTENESH
jgi:hypothetical protein